MARGKRPSPLLDAISMAIIGEVEEELEFRGFTNDDCEFDKEHGIITFHVTNEQQLHAIYQMIPQCLLNNGITTIIK